MNSKINNILSQMEQHHINSFIITDPSAIFYLTQKKFSTGQRMLALLLTVGQIPKLFIHEMFDASGLDEILIQYYKDTDPYLKELFANLDKSKILAVDKEMKARFLVDLLNLGLEKPVVLGSHLIDDMRAIKNADEIEKMRHASAINDAVMVDLQDYISTATHDLSESHLRNVLSDLYTKHQADGFSFEPIIAFGKNAADPHHETDDTILKEGNCIVIDIGCVKDDFCSDMTRTVFYKEVSPSHQEIYEIVKQAQILATQAIKPGVKCSEIDKIARDYISNKGYGEYFTHRLGHFIGMQVHEAGDISATNDQEVKPGMIFSIEPGIYIYSQNIGVRLENLVLVTNEGHQSLNQISLDLKIL